MKKFNSLDELEATRKKIDSKFKDGMPTYLTDYFDKEFGRITLAASYKAAAVAKYTHTDEERYEYKKKKEEEF